MRRRFAKINARKQRCFNKAEARILTSLICSACQLLVYNGLVDPLPLILRYPAIVIQRTISRGVISMNLSPVLSGDRCRYRIHHLRFACIFQHLPFTVRNIDDEDDVCPIMLAVRCTAALVQPVIRRIRRKNLIIIYATVTTDRSRISARWNLEKCDHCQSFDESLRDYLPSKTKFEKLTMTITMRSNRQSISCYYLRTYL